MVGQRPRNPRLSCRLGLTFLFLALLHTGRAGVLLDVQWLPPNQVVLSWPSGT
jgi:hypothetical protein